jgi:hypothetical protein
MDTSNFDNVDHHWQSLYRIGGTAAVLAVLAGLIEIAITFMPGGNITPATINDWFALFQTNWFLGLRNLGLLNMLINILGIFIFFALFGALRQVNQPYAALALIMFIIGVAVFYATNRAFSMLELSNQYAAAATDRQRMAVEAAGQALLATGRSHAPGTFLAFFFLEISGMGMSWVMLRSRVFSRVNAYAGLIGFGLLLAYEISASFIPAVQSALVLTMLGGLAVMVWYLLIARQLFRLARR